jgi:hypothetical protein
MFSPKLYILLLLTMIGIISGCKNLPRDNPLDQPGFYIQLNEIDILQDTPLGFSGNSNTNNGILNPDEAIYLNLEWKNTGRDTATGISVRYSTQSPYIRMKSPGNGSFSSISNLYNQHIWRTEMNFDVLPTAPSNPEGTKVTFLVDMKMKKQYTDKNGFTRTGDEIAKSYSFDVFIY